MTGVKAAALSYAAFGWRVFPMSVGKKPLTSHGRSDATDSPELIENWFRKWPDALVALATGAESGIVAIDVDVDQSRGIWGFDALEDIAGPFHHQTPTAHSPRGGCHLMFKHPGHFVKTVAGKLGPGLDIRGDGGSLILPPGPGRFWDPILNIDTVELAPFPAWGAIPEPKRVQRDRPVEKPSSRYGEVALDSAVTAIIAAPLGQQETTLNKECFAIGSLVAGGSIPAALATEALKWAASRMPSHDSLRPWRPAELGRKVDSALLAGMRHPRRLAA